MKRLVLALAALGVIASANAEVYTFTPNPSDLNDLDHFYYYTWGINWDKPADEVIVEAELSIRNIWNWDDEDNILYVHLLDNPQLGVKSFWDDQGGGNAFAGQGTQIGTWSDPNGGVNDGYDLKFKFSQLGLIDDLNTYLANDRFGFGFDPDCHYFNDGVKFKITTAPVPEPTSMVALGLGVVGLARRFRRKKA